MRHAMPQGASLHSPLLAELTGNVCCDVLGSHFQAAGSWQLLANSICLRVGAAQRLKTQAVHVASYVT